MRKIVTMLSALGVLAAAAPAAAQWQNDRYGNYSGYGQERYDDYGSRDGNYVGAQIDRLARVIDRQYRRGTLTSSEARSLQRELSYVAQLDRRARYGGYNGYEQRQLQVRLDRIAQRIRYEARDGDYRDDRYGRYGYEWRR